MARALIGKKAGSDVEVSTPGGTRWYTIISLAYV
jgi:transcription elongation GreA/GreB family factor